MRGGWSLTLLVGEVFGGSCWPVVDVWSDLGKDSVFGESADSFADVLIVFVDDFGEEVDGGSSVCVDLVFERSREITVDVKATTWGWAKNRVPLLKIRKDKFDPESVDIYFLTEVVDGKTVRLVGYIEAAMVPHAAEEVESGETYRADDPDRRFTSRADNYVVEPSDRD